MRDDHVMRDCRCAYPDALAIECLDISAAICSCGPASSSTSVCAPILRDVQQRTWRIMPLWMYAFRQTHKAHGCAYLGKLALHQHAISAVPYRPNVLVNGSRKNG